MKSQENFEIAIKSQHFRFNSAHFLTNPPEALHGHNYRAKIKLFGFYKGKFNEFSDEI